MPAMAWPSGSTPRRAGFSFNVPSRLCPVKDVFEEIAGAGGVRIDESKAVEIGVIDDHPAYATPTEDGDFCLYFAPNERSGPNGGVCFPEAVEPGDIRLAPEFGHEGGFVFGRVGSD